MIKISLIIPYLNEEKNIRYTLNQILNQTLKPNEVIFINSGSNDKTETIINEFIKKKKIKNFKNIFLNTKFPSDSKNLGVQLSKFQYLAFMDCGLKFEKNWLLKQKEILVKKKMDIVLGSCILKGHSLFDKAAVANTYGINTLRECVPGTLIKKKVFIDIGFFKPYRSFYDVYWKKQIYKNKFKFSKSNAEPLQYIGTNYAKNISGLFKKNLLYYKSSISFITSIFPILYIFTSLILIFVFFKNIIAFIFFLFAYFFLRLKIARKKSSINISFLNFSLIFNILKTGTIIDLSNTIASYINLFKNLGIRNFFTFLLIIYIFIFNSPIFSYLGKNLAVYKDLSSKKDIVIFVGDGEVNYFNFSYKNRLKNILSYKKNINNIFIITGRLSEVSDSLTLKGLLIQNNIDKDRIFILDKENKTNTYFNVLKVLKVLKERDINEVYFITSPFHVKRINLILKKIKSNINFVPLKNVDHNYDKKIFESWRPTFSEIKSIFYEYLAIIYYNFRGYI